MGIEEIYQNIINAICGKPISNLILSDEKLKAYPLNLGKKFPQNSNEFQESISDSFSSCII